MLWEKNTVRLAGAGAGGWSGVRGKYCWAGAGAGAGCRTQWESCGVQTSLSETKNFQVSLFFRPVAFYPNITVHPLLPALKSYRCWNSVLAVLFARAWPWGHPVSCSSSIMAALRSADSTAMEQQREIWLCRNKSKNLAVADQLIVVLYLSVYLKLKIMYMTFTPLPS